MSLPGNETAIAHSRIAMQIYYFFMNCTNQMQRKFKKSHFSPLFCHIRLADLPFSRTISTIFCMKNMFRRMATNTKSPSQPYSQDGLLSLVKGNLFTSFLQEPQQVSQQVLPQEQPQPLRQQLELQRQERHQPLHLLQVLQELLSAQKRRNLGGL